MKKRILTLTVSSMMVLAAFAPAALATIEVGPGNGNPQTNESGKCPAGQNKDTSVGGLKKCP